MDERYRAVSQDVLPEEGDILDGSIDHEGFVLEATSKTLTMEYKERLAAPTGRHGESPRTDRTGHDERP